MDSMQNLPFILGEIKTKLNDGSAVTDSIRRYLKRIKGRSWCLAGGPGDPGAFSSWSSCMSFVVNSLQ